MNDTKLQQQVKRTKLWKTIMFSFVAVILVAFLSGLGIFLHQHTFTTEKWMNESDKRINVVNNMLKKHPLVGMTRDEIIALLGEEDSYADNKTSFKITQTYFDPENTLVYYLGVTYMDDQWLIISLENDVVKNYLIDIT